MLRVGLEFLTELAHVDSQILGVIGIGRTPNLREDALMREYPSVIGCEIGEEFVFRAGQFYFLVAALDDVPRKINDKHTRFNNFALPVLRAFSDRKSVV